MAPATNTTSTDALPPPDRSKLDASRLSDGTWEIISPGSGKRVRCIRIDVTGRHADTIHRNGTLKTVSSVLEASLVYPRPPAGSSWPSDMRVIQIEMYAPVSASDADFRFLQIELSRSDAYVCGRTVVVQPCGSPLTPRAFRASCDRSACAPPDRRDGGGEHDDRRDDRKDTRKDDAPVVSPLFWVGVGVAALSVIILIVLAIWGLVSMFSGSSGDGGDTSGTSIQTVVSNAPAAPTAPTASIASIAPTATATPVAPTPSPVPLFVPPAAPPAVAKPVPFVPFRAPAPPIRQVGGRGCVASTSSRARTRR
jgi:hypothetical protein